MSERLADLNFYRRLEAQRLRTMKNKLEECAMVLEGPVAERYFDDDLRERLIAHRADAYRAIKFIEQLLSDLN